MDFMSGFWLWLGKIAAELAIFFGVIIFIFLVGVYAMWVDSKRPCWKCKGRGGDTPSSHCHVCFKKGVQLQMIHNKELKEWFDYNGKGRFDTELEALNALQGREA